MLRCTIRVLSQGCQWLDVSVGGVVDWNPQSERDGMMIRDMPRTVKQQLQTPNQPLADHIRMSLYHIISDTV